MAKRKILLLEFQWYIDENKIIVAFAIFFFFFVFKDTRKRITYPNLPSEVRPGPHGSDLPIPTSLINLIKKFT